MLVPRSHTGGSGGIGVLHGPNEFLHNLLKKWRQFWATAEAIDRASRYFFPITYAAFILGYFSLLMRPQGQEAVSMDIPT